MIHESRLRQDRAGQRPLRPARTARVDLRSGSHAMPDASLKEVLAMEINSWLRGGNSGGTAEAGRGVFTVLIALGLLMLAGWGCNQDRKARDHLAIGDRAMSAGQLADAEREYQTAIQIAPNQAPAHVALAADYVAQSQFGMAEEQYRAAIALDPAAVKSRLELGTVLASEQAPVEAEAEFRTAIGLDPNNAQGHFRLANLLSAETGREQEAQSEYQKARALDPGLAAPAVPAVPSAPGAAAQTASSASATPPMKEFNKKFLLTRNSQVYEQPEETSPVVGAVHRRKFVRVTAISGDWLCVQLRSGTVGFIPASAAE
jgi:tetratricopeptide (TPR) repeat protein